MDRLRIETRLHRRLANLAGVVIIGGLMGYALFAQYVQGYEACPLCIFQRVAMLAVAAVLLVAALHAPVGHGARAYGVLGALAAAIGAGISGWHVYIQITPNPPACGPGLDYMLDAFPIVDVIRMVFTGSGECAEINWSFLGLSMPAWVLIWFAILGTLAVVANWWRVRP